MQLQSSADIKQDTQISSDDIKQDKQNKLKILQNQQDIIKSVHLISRDFYPGKIFWQMESVDHVQFKRGKDLDSFHKFLHAANESGMLTRSELVSNLPPLFLDIQPHDLVLDMCAAPGSKSSQILELMTKNIHQQNNLNNQMISEGGLVSNDSNYSRTFTLLHNLHRLNNQHCLLVTNNDGRFFPNVFKRDDNLNNLNDLNEDNCPMQFCFDKVLCDVPCSSDGAVRKQPNTLAQWDPHGGTTAHTLQVKLLMRSLFLTKINGLVMYSTCSLNPIENEAVVSEIFRKCLPGSVSLIDINGKLPGLLGRRGMCQWPVVERKKTQKSKANLQEDKQQQPSADQQQYQFDDLFYQFKSFDEFQQIKSQKQFPSQIQESMFPSDPQMMEKVVQIQHSMRILPHDQNTGGFFLALFRKNADLLPMQNQDKQSYDLNEIQSAEQSQKKAIDNENTQKKKKSMHKSKKMKNDNGNGAALDNINDNDNIDEGKGKGNDKKQKETKNDPHQEHLYTIKTEDLEYIKKYFGIAETFPFDQLVYCKKGKERKILFVSKKLKQLIDRDQNNKINKLQAGTGAFTKIREKHSQHCKFRINQAFVLTVLPFIFIHERKVRCTFANFQFLISHSHYVIKDIEDEGFRKLNENVPIGSFIFYFDEEIEQSQIQDAFSCYKFKDNVSVQCPKELIQSYICRYL